MAEEVAHVVLERAGLQQPGSELAPQVVELEVDHTSTSLGRPPRRVDAEHPLPHLGAEHERVDAQKRSSGVCRAHLKLSTKATANGDDTRLIGLRPVGREHQPPDLPLLVAPHFAPLKAEQFPDAATGTQGRDDESPQVWFGNSEQSLFLTGLEAAVARRLCAHIEADDGYAVSLEGRGVKVAFADRPVEHMAQAGEQPIDADLAGLSMRPNPGTGLQRRGDRDALPALLCPPQGLKPRDLQGGNFCVS